MSDGDEVAVRGRQYLFGGFFFAVLLFLLYQFYVVFSFFLVPLAWAGLLALVFFPLFQRTVTLLRGRAGLASFLFTTAVILVVIVPTILLLLSLARESVQFVQRIQSAYETGEMVQWLDTVRASRVGHLWERVAPILREWKIDPATVGLSASNSASQFLVGQVGSLATNALRFVGNFFLVTFALFFFFRDGERMVQGFHDLLPMEPHHKDLILNRLYDALSAVVQGTLATAVVQGLLAGIGFWLASVPFAVLLGGLTALVSMIPFGTPLVWLGAVVYLCLAEAFGRAIFVAAWGILIIGSADNVIRPLIIGGRTELPTVFLFFGILGGLQAYGFLGMFVGPVVIAILVTFLRIYREEYAGTDVRRILLG